MRYASKSAGAAAAEADVNAVVDAAAEGEAEVDADTGPTAMRFDGGWRAGDAAGRFDNVFGSMGWSGERNRSSGPFATLGSLAIGFGGIGTQTEDDWNTQTGLVRLDVDGV